MKKLSYWDTQNRRMIELADEVWKHVWVKFDGEIDMGDDLPGRLADAAAKAVHDILSEEFGKEASDA